MKNKSKEKEKYFSAAEKGSFAEFTVEKRFPKIFKEVCSEEYDSFIENHKVDDGKILHSNIPGVDELKKSISSYKDYTIKDFFEKAPFFLVEFYFYHLLLSLRNYDKLKFDFFAAKKDADWKDKTEDFSSKLSVLFDDFEKFNKIKFSKKEKQEFNERKNEHIKSILYYSLTSNTGDLSQLHEISSESVKCLCNETEICKNYLDVAKPYSRFDIVCDNSGAELFSDIYLAVFFLVYGLAKKVVLHLKPCPFFVSDATIDDFSKLVSALIKNGKNTELLDFISKKKIEVWTNDFWVEPYYFDKMPDDLKNHFDKSDLVIIKGDLNYRRLVGDFNNYTDKAKSSIKFERLEERCLFKNKSNKNIPLVAPRVLKSDVFVGIDTVFEAIGRNSDSQFKTDGKWGVIQTTLPRKTSVRTKKKIKSVSDKNAEKKDNKSDSSKDNESKHSISEICFFILFLLVALLLIGSLVAVLLIVFSKPLVENWNCKFLENIANFSPKETAERIDFSIILTSLSLLVGGSIFVPKFLLQKEVEESVQEEIKKNVKKRIQEESDEYIASKFSSVSNSLNKCDAHLSRMIAFNLKEDFPVWSIGWSIRSLKRYEILDPNSVGFIEYFDFVEFLRKTVIEGSAQKFFAIVKKDVKNEINPVMAALEKEAEKSGNDSKRLAIRTVKDIIDFEYSVQFKNKDLKNRSILLPVCNLIGGLAKCLCSAVMVNSQNEKLSEQNLLYRELLEQILQISDYGKKCKDFDAKKDYENRLILVLKELEEYVKNKNENYIKGFEKSDILFFQSK